MDPAKLVLPPLGTPPRHKPLISCQSRFYQSRLFWTLSPVATSSLDDRCDICVPDFSC
jgi:hypothetical protein